jgi:hypothetical protein
MIIVDSNFKALENCKFFALPFHSSRYTGRRGAVLLSGREEIERTKNALAVFVKHRSIEFVSDRSEGDYLSAAGAGHVPCIVLAILA